MTLRFYTPQHDNLKTVPNTGHESKMSLSMQKISVNIGDAILNRQKETFASSSKTYQCLMLNSYSIDGINF